MSDVALAIAAIAEVAKLMIMAQNTAIKNGLTPEQFKAIADAVASGFAARDPKTLPDK